MLSIHKRIDNPYMDTSHDFAPIRERLKALSRKEAMVIAAETGIPKPTMEKIRAGRIVDPGYSKGAAIDAALQKRETPSMTSPPAAKG